MKENRAVSTRGGSFKSYRRLPSPSSLAHFAQCTAHHHDRVADYFEPEVATTCLAMGNIPPTINDVATDLVDPPTFPSGDIRPLPESFKPIIANYYKDLKTLHAPGTTKDAVFDKALEVAKATPRWAITTEDKTTGLIQGVATTALIGFQDDFVVRIREQSSDVLVDMRSRSRLGKGDIGANAARIMDYFKRVQARL